MRDLTKKRIASYVVFKEDDKYLLVQEKTSRIRGLWGLPGGAVDADETPIMAAEREAEEEVGYDIRIIKKLGTYEDQERNSTRNIFLGEIISGKLKYPKMELMDAQWFTLDEVKEMKDKLRGEWVLGAIGCYNAVMKIYKIGHSCFVLEEGNTKVMTDPGNTSTEQVETKDLDAIFITHIHGDHLDVESFKKVVENNPEARIIGNREVVDLLAKESVEAEVVSDGDKVEVGDFKVKAFETDHHFIYEGIPLPRNTGFLFNEKVYHPGDAMEVNPGKVALLGIPIGAPFASMKEYLDYGKMVMPEKAMPTHDGMLKELGPFGRVPEMIFSKMGIEFIPLRPGEEVEI